MGRYLRRTFVVPEALQEEVVAALAEENTLGAQIFGEGSAFLRLDAYFALPREDRPDPLLGADWRARRVSLVEEEELAEEDWLATFRRQSVPKSLGRHFEVDAREPVDEPSRPCSGRRLLRLPARRAFGTGEHATTRLMVEALEDLPLGGLRVLDVGVGTGILSFAALHLGARSVMAFDVDLEAALLARENTRLNRLFPTLFAGRLHCLRGAGRFDLVLVNVLPERIAADLERLGCYLRSRGRMLLSGFLWCDRSTIEGRLCELGWRVEERRQEGDWGLLSLRLEGT